jgi:hypothetical protein
MSTHGGARVKGIGVQPPAARKNIARKSIGVEEIGTEGLGDEKIESRESLAF